MPSAARKASSTPCDFALPTLSVTVCGMDAPGDNAGSCMSVQSTIKSATSKFTRPSASQPFVPSSQVQFSSGSNDSSAATLAFCVEAAGLDALGSRRVDHQRISRAEIDREARGEERPGIVERAWIRGSRDRRGLACSASSSSA